MTKQIKGLLAVMAAFIIMASVVPAYALVIGDWEQQSDGWVDWDWSNPIEFIDEPEKYAYSDSVGVTRGGYSLEVTQESWNDVLGLKMDYNQRVAFMENNRLTVDVSVAASEGVYTTGYSQVTQVVFNAQGGGTVNVSGSNPITFYWWDTAGERTQTMEIDYSDFKQAIIDELGAGVVPGWVEIIISQQVGGGAPPQMYYDNAQLSSSSYVPPYDEVVMEDEPVLYLRLEEDTPTSTASGNGVQVDSSGNEFWAAHRAATEFRENAGIGNARYLRNDPQNAIAAANQTADPGWGNNVGDQYAFAKGQITFEFWMKSDAMDAYGMFFQQVKENQQKAPGMSNSDGTIRILNGVNQSDPNLQGWWYTGVETPLDNQWHHMVVTYEENYEGDPNAMQIQFYLDGAFAGSVITEDTDGKGLGPELDHIIFGGLNDKGYTYNRYYGFIDEIAIYDKVLDADRILAHYEAGIYAATPQDCEDAWSRGLGLPGDIDRNCKVNLADFAVLAGDWLRCNDPLQFGVDLTCMPNW